MHGNSIELDFAGAKGRQDLVFAAIAKAGRPVDLRYLVDRLRLKMRKGQIRSAIECLRKKERIEVVTPGKSGWIGNTYQPVATKEEPTE